MKAHLTLFFALLLICSGAALAQGTPDWMTPAEETICDGETGAAFGLCNAFCEAMDCDSANAQASPTACTKVKDKFTNVTGRPFLPCQTCPPPPAGTTCPCVDAFPDFTLVLDSPTMNCFEFGTFATKEVSFGAIAASCSALPPYGVFCGVRIGDTDPLILTITPEEGAACTQLIRQSCGPV